MSEGVINDATMRLRQVPCPAGEEIADALDSDYANAPGVLCRITWDVQTPDKNPNVLVRYCANPCGGDGGYTECPVWQFDKQRIWDNRKSFGDQREQEDQDLRTWREDLTGSEYADTSFMDPIEAAVNENLEHMQETGGIEATTGVDFEP